MNVPSIADIERAFCEPATNWEGRCHELAYEVTKLVPGSFLARGHWYGCAKGYWWKRAHLPFQAHSWAVAPDKKTVIDPTRWSFECAEPYVFVGREEDHQCCDMFCGNTGEDDEECHCGHMREDHGVGFLTGCQICKPWPYDEGGNMNRMRQRRPCPAAEPSTAKWDVSQLAPDHASHIVALVKQSGGDLADGKLLTDQQLLWLANLPAQDFGKYGQDTALWYEHIHMKGLFPIDNFNMLTR